MFGDQHREQAAERRRQNDADDRDERELEVVIEHEQDAEDEDDRDRQHDVHLRARRGVLLELAAPAHGVADRQRDLLVDRGLRFGDGTREIASFDGILHADVARVVLAIDERRAVGDFDVRDFTQRNLLPVRRREQDVADLLRRRAVLRLQAHDEIERALALHDLRCRRAADRRFDQAIHRVGAQAVARQLCRGRR